MIDPFPTGLTPPPTAVGQGGTYGPYVPTPAVPGHDDGPPILDTAMTVGSGVVTAGRRRQRDAEREEQRRGDERLPVRPQRGRR